MRVHVTLPIATATAALALVLLRGRDAVAALRRLWLRREIWHAQRLLQELQELACRCAAAEGRAARSLLKESLNASVSARALVDNRLLQLIDPSHSPGAGTLQVLRLRAARIKAECGARLAATEEPTRRPPSRAELIKAECAALCALGAGPGPRALAAALDALRRLESSLEFQAELLREQMRVHELSGYSKDNFACARHAARFPSDPSPTPTPAPSLTPRLVVISRALRALFWGRGFRRVRTMGRRFDAAGRVACSLWQQCGAHACAGAGGGGGGGGGERRRGRLGELRRVRLLPWLVVPVRRLRLWPAQRRGRAAAAARAHRHMHRAASGRPRCALHLRRHATARRAARAAPHAHLTVLGRAPLREAPPRADELRPEWPPRLPGPVTAPVAEGGTAAAHQRQRGRARAAKSGAKG